MGWKKKTKLVEGKISASIKQIFFCLQCLQNLLACPLLAFHWFCFPTEMLGKLQRRKDVLLSAKRLFIYRFLEYFLCARHWGLGKRVTLEVSAEGCGSQGRLPGGGGISRKKSPIGELGEVNRPWGRPRNTDHRVGVGQPKGTISLKLENSVFRQPQKQLIGVCFESHHSS